LQRIEMLAENPRGEGCVKLSAQERYRVRQGVYRVVYEIRDESLVVLVVKVAHRSVVYKGN
jgi:mRNA interferase RelE/StbE